MTTMKLQNRRALSLCLALLASVTSTAHLASGQSLTRFQLPGGRQHALGVQIAAFTNNEDYFFASVPDGFVPGDVNGFNDVVRYGLGTGLYELVVTGAGGVPADQDCSPVDASTDGRFVLFLSDATNLGPVHQNNMTDLFLRDLQFSTTERVSWTAAGAEPDGSSGRGSLSDDGRFVVFDSEATDMLPLDNNQVQDVFLRDLALSTTVLLSGSIGGGFANGASYSPQISIDGRYVMFLSQASDLVPGDTNGKQDLFRVDLQAGGITRIVLGPGGVEPNGDVLTFSMSQSGELVAFDSLATNLTGQACGPQEIYVRDMVNDFLARVSGVPGGPLPDAICYNPTMSGDSGWVTYLTAANNIDPGDTDGEVDVYYVDVGGGFVYWVSRSTSGLPGQPPTGQLNFMETGIGSYTGGYTVFYSNLEGLVAGDTNQTGDTFLYNQTTSGGPIDSFCTAKVNSLGCLPTITSGGEARLSGPLDAFFVSAHDVRNNEPGILLWSFAPASQPFFGGTLCLAGPVRRTPPQVAGGSPSGHDCSGTFSFHFSQAYMALKGIPSGVPLYTQYWMRDNGYAPPNNVGLTGGLSFVAAP